MLSFGRNYCLCTYPTKTRNQAARAKAKKLAEVRWHPKHEHALRRNKSGGWNCDVCHRKHLGRSDERWRSVAGFDWDCCGECIPKPPTNQTPDSPADVAVGVLLSNRLLCSLAVSFLVLLVMLANRTLTNQDTSNTKEHQRLAILCLSILAVSRLDFHSPYLANEVASSPLCLFSQPQTHSPNDRFPAGGRAHEACAAKHCRPYC